MAVDWLKRRHLTFRLLQLLWYWLGCMLAAAEKDAELGTLIFTLIFFMRRLEEVKVGSNRRLQLVAAQVAIAFFRALG